MRLHFTEIFADLQQNALIFVLVFAVKAPEHQNKVLVYLSGAAALQQPRLQVIDVFDLELRPLVVQGRIPLNRLIQLGLHIDPSNFEDIVVVEAAEGGVGYRRIQGLDLDDFLLPYVERLAEVYNFLVLGFTAY